MLAHCSDPERERHDHERRRAMQRLRHMPATCLAVFGECAVTEAVAAAMFR